MPSIILSDNGVSSGSAGLKSTAASDGVLILQTTTSGGTATNAIYVDTSQLVGLGTTPAAKLHLLTTGNTTADGVRLTLGSEGRSHNIYSALATGRDLTIAPYRSLTINTGSGTNEGIVTLNSYEYTVFGTGSSYTERMRLDASGNLGIGTTSPAYRLDVRDTNATVFSRGTAGYGAFYAQGSGTNSSYIFMGNATSGEQGRITCADTGILTFSNGSGATERMRIDASGVLAIGTTSGAAATRLVVQGSGTGSNTLATFKDSSANTLMMVSENGNFLVGTTNPASNAGNGLKVTNAGGVYAVGTSGDTYNFYNSTAGAYRFYVTNAGVINATSTTITAISDQRLKENIQDIDVGLNAVLALKPRKFDWKDGKGKDKKGDRGWIAQEFEQVFPDMITTWKDAPPEGEEPYKAVNADLIPVLVKAIQELKAELDTAKEQIAILQGAQQ